jgi:hypothetical protein
MSIDVAENQKVAQMLRELAGLLQAQGANPFRVSAYRKAADALARWDRPLRDIFDREGRDGLQKIPGVGPGIASAIAEILITGRWSQLERLRGSVEPEQLLQSVPGIGPELARLIHESLHVDTLEGLELAANNGRLESLPGLGPRRVQMIRASLAAMLGRRRPVRRSAVPTEEPSIAALLAVDREYRERAAARSLPTIAPKRFNPTGEAWLPVLHTAGEGWHFTALFSNTAQAHRLGRTRDWVVVYFYDKDHIEGQHTIVTESRGALSGRRVVRGREDECRAYYASAQQTV